MTAREKITAAVAFLKARGVKRPDPPLFRLMWWLGVPIPPPHFLGFLPLALLFGLPYGTLLAVALGLANAVMGWNRPWAQLALAVPAGLLFGVAMAAVQKVAQRGIEVPRWSDFGTVADVEDDTW